MCTVSQIASNPCAEEEQDNGPVRSGLGHPFARDKKGRHRFPDSRAVGQLPLGPSHGHHGEIPAADWQIGRTGYHGFPP